MTRQPDQPNTNTSDYRHQHRGTPHKTGVSVVDRRHFRTRAERSDGWFNELDIRLEPKAAIAALHAQAPSYDETDWPQIRTLYDALLRVWPTPIVALNRAVAVAMVDGPAVGLAALEPLEEPLATYRYLPATKADFLRRLGRDAEARDAYARALALTENAAERAFLERELSATPGRPR